MISIFKFVNASLLNIRKGPGTNHQIIKGIPKGEQVEVLSVQDGWSNIKYNDIVGYVSSEYLIDDIVLQEDRDLVNYLNNNNIISKTNYLIYTKLNNKHTYVFEKINNRWEMKFKWLCTIGKQVSQTIVGLYEVGIKYPVYRDKTYMVKYVIQIFDDYYYHSILYNTDEVTIKDDRLGLELSLGCIRLATDNAKWLYYYMPSTTKIIID